MASQTQNKDAVSVTLGMRVRTFLSRLKPRKATSTPQPAKTTLTGSDTSTSSTKESDTSTLTTNTTSPTESEASTGDKTTTTTTESLTETNLQFASDNNKTLVSGPRKYSPRSTKIRVLDVLPKQRFISHISRKPQDRHTKVYHVDPTSLPKIPLRSRRSITNFQYSRLITEKEAETECRALREIRAQDADKYTRLGFEITGQYIIVDSRFIGEVARTTVGWIRAEKMYPYWQYLTDNDEDMIEIMRYKIWSPGSEVCATFLREEEVMNCRKLKD